MRDLVAGFPAAVAYLSGPDLVIEFANDSYRALAGGRDPVGLPLRETLPPGTSGRVLEALSQLMAGGQPADPAVAGIWTHEQHGVFEQLSEDFACQPVRGDDGEIAGILLYAADVTAHGRDLRQLDELSRALAAKEERLRTLLAATPSGVLHVDADGSVISANQSASEILGLDVTAITRWPVSPADRAALHEDGSPFRPEELPVRVALRTGEVVPDVIAGVPHGQTGEIRWLRITAVPDAEDLPGHPHRAYAIFTDLTEQRRMEAELRESTGLLGQLREANVLGVVASDEQCAYDANDAFLDMIGYSREDLRAGRISQASITAPEWEYRDRDANLQLRSTGVFQPYDKEYLHRSGHRVPVLVGGALISRHPLRWVTFAVDLTARQRAERERADLLAREDTARAQAEYARERLIFLLRAGAMVAATRNRGELLEHAAQLVVPTLADHCVVWLPTAEDTLQATALAHGDPQRARVLRELRDHRIPAAGPMSVQLAYTTGESQLLRDARAQLPRWQGLAPELAEVLARLRADSVLAVPLLIDELPAGILALARDADRPEFTSTDIEVVEEFARRLSDGMATADAFVREHTIAETLQRSLLPGSLPRIPGLDLTVSYLPASDGVHVGGDWYDAFRLCSGEIGLVIGDVTGHNLTSAATMGQVRSLLRAYAIDHKDPRDVLEHTNRALTSLLPDALATAVYLVLDPRTGELAYANAGHPPPLAVTRSGGPEYLDDAPGTMLGASTDIDLRAGRRRLPPGSGLVLYTDGLIEDRYRDISDGFSTLAASIGRVTTSSAGQLSIAAQSVLSGAPTRADDVCLLTARLPG